MLSNFIVQSNQTNFNDRHQGGILCYWSYFVLILLLMRNNRKFYFKEKMDLKGVNFRQEDPTFFVFNF